MSSPVQQEKREGTMTEVERNKQKGFKGISTPAQQESEPQQWGTMTELERNKKASGSSSPSAQGSSFQAQDYRDNTVMSARDALEDEEWEIVSHEQTDDDSNHSCGRRTSGHFDLTLGWGEWKHTVYSSNWSYSVQHEHEDDHPEASFDNSRSS